jgi:hypothetical protein
MKLTKQRLVKKEALAILTQVIQKTDEKDVKDILTACSGLIIEGWDTCESLNTKGFHTEFNVNVHKNIQDGKTLLYRTKEDAMLAAELRKSYFYEVFEDGSVNGFYAVPK